MMRRKRLGSEEGFTFIEILIVVAIIGILLLVSYPNIMNTRETRSLENKARELLTTLQQAKFQAVRLKLFHRVRFDNSSGMWVYFLEREVSAGNWVEVPGQVRKAIPGKFNVTVNLPVQIVEFSPVGSVSNYSATQHDVSLQSPSLSAQNQPSTRTISIYWGGSVQYIKST